MKSTGWHFMHGTREIWAATKTEIRRLAQTVADQTGAAVKVLPGRRPAKRPAAAKPRPAAARRVLKRNPDPLHFLGVWEQQNKSRATRADYIKRTKAERIGKSLAKRGRGNAVTRKEAGARKTAKFQVDAVRGNDRFTLGRPSRSAAEALADQFLAAGYKVKVSEA